MSDSGFKPVFAKASPAKGVVDVLEAALERAKRGEIQGVAVAMSLTERTVATDFVWAEGVSEFQLLGVVHAMADRMVGVINDPDR